MEDHSGRLRSRGVAAEQVVLPYCRSYPQYCWQDNGQPWTVRNHKSDNNHSYLGLRFLALLIVLALYLLSLRFPFLYDALHLRIRAPEIKSDRKA